MQAAVEEYKTAFLGQFPVYDGDKGLYCHKRLLHDEASLISTISTFSQACVKFPGKRIHIHNIMQVDGDVSIEDPSRNKTRQFKVRY